MKKIKLSGIYECMLQKRRLYPNYEFTAERKMFNSCVLVKDDSDEGQYDLSGKATNTVSFIRERKF